jgi:hypothetical protein
MCSHHGRWVMPEEDIPSMLQMIDERIASPRVEVRHRDILIRLRSLLEDDLQPARKMPSRPTGRTPKKPLVRYTR